MRTFFGAIGQLKVKSRGTQKTQRLKRLLIILALTRAVASQSKQVSGYLAKKYSRLCYGGSQGQGLNTLVTGVNTTAVKKGKKVEVDLSWIKYYNYHKKGYYTNKYPNKEPKTSINLGDLHVNDCN